LPNDEVRFKASAKLMGYLRLLARDTMLGSTTNAVAEHLLTVEAERRFLEGYHAKVVPTVDTDGEEVSKVG
jgi:hypothetical protein